VWAPVPLLTRQEATDLAFKLRAAAKLGKFAGLTDDMLAKKFIRQHDADWGGQSVLVILLELVPGGRFIDKLKSEWNSIPPDTRRICYGIVCLSTAAGLPLSGAVLLRAVGAPISLSPEDPEAAPLHGSIVRTRGDAYKARHRVIAEHLLRDCMSRAEVHDASSRLMRALAPYVSRRTIMQRTDEARAVRALMDADGIFVPLLGAEAEKWFEELQPQWEWNSRYWEQRALVALRAKEYARARDFANTARGVEAHPFPMTTCALVFLVSVQDDGSLGVVERRLLFKQALDLLDVAITQGEAQGLTDPHPFHVLFVRAAETQRRLREGLAELTGVLRKHAPSLLQRHRSDTSLMAALGKLKADGTIR
jgi:hypothetical protein